MAQRIALYLYATSEFAEVYEPDHKKSFGITFTDPDALDTLVFLLNAQDTAEQLVKGNGQGFEELLNNTVDFYSVEEVIASDLDPTEMVPFTVAISYLAHENPRFGEFLDSLNFNHQHIENVCNNWVAGTYLM